MNKKTKFTKNEFKEINILVSDQMFLELDSFSKALSDIPFYCFQEENSSTSIEDLDFNKLKKCEVDKEIEYMVVFLKEFGNITNSINSNNKFDEWHNKNPSVEIKLVASDSTEVTFCGKMKKIFYKGFSPDIVKST